MHDLACAQDSLIRLLVWLAPNTVCVWYSLIDGLQQLGVAVETFLLLILLVVIAGSSEDVLGAELHGILFGPPFILANNQGSVPQGIEPVTSQVFASL